MTDHDDLEARVTALEDHVLHARYDCAARILAGGADRDVADMKQTMNGHTKVLNAMRETQLEHGERLNAHDARFDRLDAKIEHLDAKVEHLDTKMDSGFTKVNIGMGQIATLLQSVIDKD